MTLQRINYSVTRFLQIRLNFKDQQMRGKRDLFLHNEWVDETTVGKFLQARVEHTKPKVQSTWK